MSSMQKLDWRREIFGMTWGFTTRSTNDNLQTYETFASVGYNNKKTYWEKGRCGVYI